MPRLVAAFPKYRKHRASGQAVVTIHGRDHYLGPHGTSASKAFYDRLIAEWLTQGRRSHAPPVEQTTVVMLCARYLQFATGYYLKDGKCTGTVPAIKAAMKYLRAWYGRTPAADFGPLALKALRQQMVDDGLSRSYVNDHVARIKRIFKWGVSEQLVPPATYQGLASVQGLLRGRTTAPENPPILPVDDAIVEATLPFMPEVVADMVRLQRLTGMRPAEVCIVRPGDVDRSGEVWLYRPASHKTEHHGRERVVFLGTEAQAVLLKYLARDDRTNCFRPCDSMAKVLAAKHAARVTPLSCGNKPGSNRVRRPKKQPGDVYEVDAYRRAIARACDRAFPHPRLSAIPRKQLTSEDSAALRAWQSAHRWAPNRLRHTFATTVRKQFGLEAAQVALGHSSAVVSQIYAERDLAKGVQVAQAIG
ncbi:tyrosine-type recombinase/integrase [Lacipirellula limnantheis]|uniref:Site-specific tyrosine recombinase XerD n=1 Tax=Lacipirellula limnantheis TaxID=2528024 RepID=A0A517U1G9_9BACT|nr:site-specific integrase [Lacipirellula limnantheis]QDT74464.1 site-specific tyrosine recombinase XerD [Lacipirellula limnantheis]